MLDPLVAFLSGTINSWRDQDVRRVLAPLASLAQDRDVAVVAVLHLNKKSGADPLQRVSGAGGFTHAARSVLLLAEDPFGDDDGPQRVLAHAKCNVAARAASLACLVETAKVCSGGQSIETSRLVMVGEHKLSARALLEAACEQTDEGSALTEAITFLRAELAEGPVATNELLRRARAAAVSERTLRRAKERIGVEARQGVLPDARGWAWRLPEETDE